MNIIETMLREPDLSEFLRLIERAELIDRYSSDAPFTLLAPTNQAFADLPPGVLNEYKTTKQLQALVRHHVLPGQISWSQLTELTRAPTMQGEDLTLFGVDDLSIQGGDLTRCNIAASNGMLHVINKVLLPQEKERSGI